MGYLRAKSGGAGSMAGLGNQYGHSVRLSYLLGAQESKAANILVILDRISCDSSGSLHTHFARIPQMAISPVCLDDLGGACRDKSCLEQETSSRLTGGFYKVPSPRTKSGTTKSGTTKSGTGSCEEIGESDSIMLLRECWMPVHCTCDE